ncbi:hypothetical protein RDWZM_006254 [Blomia tropicalis]|uniref:Uncharacterized protein n=1 Tax=Blomia tropicalis TaxID=40697 RepID=A0A9Q0M9Z6_BLOTA|nr:hypothetical protein BLOT_008980 [Blomia tropicalis]KAJ6220442.1 hypothetical protein RDWZM_006254 [Blomia tropicalis]
MNNVTRDSVTKLVPLLERLSLLRINQQALDRVIRCVEFANTIEEVDTSRVTKPMISPSDGHGIYMRDDVPKQFDRAETMKNASITVEDYFTTPSKHKHFSDL